MRTEFPIASVHAGRFPSRSSSHPTSACGPPLSTRLPLPVSLLLLCPKFILTCMTLNLHLFPVHPVPTPYLLGLQVTSAQCSLLTESWIARRNNTQWIATFRS